MLGNETLIMQCLTKTTKKIVSSKFLSRLTPIHTIPEIFVRVYLFIYFVFLDPKDLRIGVDD